MKAIDSVESHPQYHYAFPILGDFLYGDLEGKELSECKILFIFIFLFHFF